MTYRVVHTTRYAYSEAVSVSHHVARVKPRICPGQECVRHELQIEPAPATVRSHQDYFGNEVTFFIVERAHKELTVRSTSTVKVHGEDAAGARGHASVGGGVRLRRAAARGDRVSLRLGVDRR